MKKESSTRNFSTIFLLSVFSIASFLGVNQYIYGHWNHYNTIPFLKNLINPNLYPGDALVEQRAYFFTYFFQFLESLLPLSGGDISLLFAMLYLPSIFFTFWAIYLLAFQLFQKREVGLIALALFVFTFPTIGYVQSWESLFYERTLSLPLLLFSIYFFLKGKLLKGSTLQGLAFLIHPLSAVYVIGATWLAQIFRAKAFPLKNLIPLFWLLLLISPVLYLKLTHSNGEGMFACDPEWLEIMRLRNFHHAFPFTFDWDLFAKSGLVILAFLFLLKTLKLEASIKRWLLGFFAAILLFLFIGTFFTEIIPLKIIIQFQFFRSFRFLIYLAIILWAGAMLELPIKKYLAISPCLLVLYFDGQISKFSAAIFVYISLLILFKIKDLGYFRNILALAFIYSAIAISAFFIRGNFTIQNQQNAEWLEVQEWVKSNTDINSLIIVPPKEWGFRLESERSIYGDWDDGTKAFFNAAYAKEWMRRMQMLNCANPDNLVLDFKENTRADFRKIVEEQSLKGIYSNYYLLSYSDMNLEADLIFENEKFKIYKL